MFIEKQSLPKEQNLQKRKKENMSYFSGPNGGSNQFWFGDGGFLIKKSGGGGNRKNPSYGLICNRPTTLFNQYKPGGSVIGGQTIANCRSKNRLATICLDPKCGRFFNSLGKCKVLLKKKKI